jgi:hypothetical protein
LEKPRHFTHTMLELLRSVVGSMALAVGGLALARQVLPVAVLEASNDVVGNYLQTLGSIYAVLLAFVVFVVWTQFNDARGHVESESNELLDLHRTAEGLPEPTRAAVHQLAREYIEVVLMQEWSGAACEGPTGPGPGPGAAILDRMWRSVHSAEPQVEPSRSLYREVLKRLDDLSDARSARLNSARTTIPRALRILLYSGAVMTTGSMYLFAVKSFAIHAAITAALAGAIAHVIFIIEDLDNCFSGHWQVPKAPFLRVRAQIVKPAE